MGHQINPVSRSHVVHEDHEVDAFVVGARNEHASALESGVRGRLQAIDDRENFVHPVVRDEVDRPLSTEVTMRAE